MLKTKKFRRLLAGLLAVLMLSVCLPVGAFATGNDGFVAGKINVTYYDDTNKVGLDNEVVNFSVEEDNKPDVISYIQSNQKYADLIAEGYTYAGMTHEYSGDPVTADTVVTDGQAIIVHFTKNTTPAESVTIRFQFVDANGAELRAATVWAGTWADGDEATSLMSIVAGDVKAVEANGYDYDYMTMVYDNGTESSSLQNPIVVPDYDGKTIKVYFEKVDPSVDVNFTVVYVDGEGNELQPATQVAATYSDFGTSQKLSTLIADEVAAVEAEGYKQVASTLVYADGSESSPLVDPYIVPDYDGKTIKVYFAKVEESEDVSIRFEFVDMEGNTLYPVTNYATTYTDSAIGPKLSSVVANEITAVEADGYKFAQFTMVYSDGSESSSLVDPVVVPDYDGKTIKVYFVKVEEYEDVNVRFEFYDLDGNTVMPATNFATCLNDGIVGPKVNDVLADELSTMEGRNYNFHHYAWVYSDGTETELDNDVIVVPDHDGTTIKVYFEAVKTEPSDPSTGDNTTTVTGKDEHPDIAEAKANGTWGAPTATPAAASTIPQTGDSMPVVMLIVIALAAAGAVGGLVVLRKRSHQ